MIQIRKDHEPRKLIRYRQQENASYANMDSDVKDELLKTLLREQGHLCAYCMSKIPERRALPQGVPSVSIEHWLPQHLDTDKGLDYRNMLAVCSGNRGCGDQDKMTCDARKGEQTIVVHPCRPETLRGITYTNAGMIRSGDPSIDEDLNVRLNLNNESTSLPENRKRALDVLIEDVRKHKGNDISLFCKRKLEKILAMDDEKLPYAGILIWWLKKHIR